MKRILIMDDDPLVRSMLRMKLEDEGFEVEEASNGKEGVATYKLNKPDVVIIDLLMPEKEGVETIQELKHFAPDVKVIAISGGGRISAEICLSMAKNLGAKYTFAKPVENEELIQAVKELTS